MTKKAVNAINAPVICQVCERFGQRTWRSSYHAPAKYSPNARSGLRRGGRAPVSVSRESGLTAGATLSLVTRVASGLLGLVAARLVVLALSLAVMRVTRVLDFLLDEDLAKALLPN